MFFLSFFLFWLPGAFHSGSTNLQINGNVLSKANLLILIICGYLPIFSRHSYYFILTFNIVSSSPENFFQITSVTKGAKG